LRKGDIFRLNDFEKESMTMSGVNQITIVGNVGQTPDLKYTEGGKPYRRFSVAVNEQWKTDGERRQRTTWFPV
jgi:single-strand DNA-binding protein